PSWPTTAGSPGWPPRPLVSVRSGRSTRPATSAIWF
ncbi:uncharacterized protein METZ01_LOCUS131046, partial [marine metagenome]